MKQLFTLTKNTFCEAIRDKVLLIIFLFGILLIGSTIFSPSLSAGEDKRILLNMGFGLFEIFGILLTVFVGMQVVSREIDQKTIIFLLSKPVRRQNVILSKFFGLALVLLIASVLMLSIFLLTLFCFQNFENSTELFYNIFLGAFFSLLSFLLFLSLLLFFSTFLRPILAAFCALTLFVVGHITDDAHVLSKYSGNSSEIYQNILEGMYFALPNFSLLNLKNSLLTGIPLSSLELFAISLGTFCWIFLLMGFSVMIFSHKEF